MNQAPAAAEILLHLDADERGKTHLGTTTVMLPVGDFAPPAAPFNVSDAQPAA